MVCHVPGRRHRAVPLLRFQQRQRARCAAARRPRRRRQGAPPGSHARGSDAISTVQRAFAEHGLPAPRPLTGPVPYGPVHITAETMLASGPPADGHDPAVRAALARGLARVVVVGRALELDGTDALHHPTAMPPDALYPPPHSARFDFEATAAGAEWIDDYARRALRRAARPATLDRTCSCTVTGASRTRTWPRARSSRSTTGTACVSSPSSSPSRPSAVTFCVDWLRPVGEHFPTNAEIRAVHRRVRDRTRCPVLRRPPAPTRGAHGLRPLLRRALRARRQLPGGRRHAAGAPTPPRRPAARSRTGRVAARIRRTGVADAARDSGGHAGSECEGALGGGLIASWEALPVVSAPGVRYLISLMMLNIGR